MIKDARIKAWYFANRNDSRCNIARIFNVEYAHIILEDGSDLYVTGHGLPFIDQLHPSCYHSDKEWFKDNAKRLSGTSCVYRIKTKTINGKNKEIVLKWNRMGEDVPGAPDLAELAYARFNSPFEEFGLVHELRDVMYQDSQIPHVIQKPLAIYVPFEKHALYRMGRRKYEMEQIMADHVEVDIDMHRSYAVVYEWIKGIDLAEAFHNGVVDEEQVKKITGAANNRLYEKGYEVKDNKPQHIIVRTDENNKLITRADGECLNAVIDFELCVRTKVRAEEVKKNKRVEYHQRQTKRFSYDSLNDFHPHLHHVQHFGVDYIYGQVESTKGRLWVVGSDPYLFDYFLPERWEKSQRTRVSMFNESYATCTKDNINVIWEVSKVGLHPDADPFKEDEKHILEYGYNSPFEEVGIAIDLNNKGIPTIYPRAIYMTSIKTEIAKQFYDESRYENHKDYATPDRLPLLSNEHEYIIIWGHWNGSDETLANDDTPHITGINALRAYRNSYISYEQYMDLVRYVRESLKRASIEDLNLRGSHLLLSLNEEGQIIYADTGLPEVRICNFEFLRKK